MTSVAVLGYWVAKSTPYLMVYQHSFSIEMIRIEYKHKYIWVLWYIIYNNDQRQQARQMAKLCAESPKQQTASSIGPSDQEI
eukprot:15359514-Ditylum_brightwellii.AAC.1